MFREAAALMLKPVMRDFLSAERRDGGSRGIDPRQCHNRIFGGMDWSSDGRLLCEKAITFIIKAET